MRKPKLSQLVDLPGMDGICGLLLAHLPQPLIRGTSPQIRPLVLRGFRLS